MTTSSAMKEREPSEADLLEIAQQIEGMKRECGMDPESPTAIYNGRLMSIAWKVRQMARFGTTAAEPVGYVTPFEWKPRQSEALMKVTRKPQPEYGYTVPVAAEPSVMDAAPQAPSGQQAEPTINFEQLYEYANARNIDYNELCQVVRAALAGHQSERPAPAGQAVGEICRALYGNSTAVMPMHEALNYKGREWLCIAYNTPEQRTAAHHALRKLEALSEALASSQAERPAVKEKP